MKKYILNFRKLEAIVSAKEAFQASMSACFFDESSVVLAYEKRNLPKYQRFASFFCRDQLVVRGAI